MNVVQSKWAASAARQAPGWPPCLKHYSLDTSRSHKTCAAFAPRRHQQMQAVLSAEVFLCRERLVTGVLVQIALCRLAKLASCEGSLPLHTPLFEAHWAESVCQQVPASRTYCCEVGDALPVPTGSA